MSIKKYIITKRLNLRFFTEDDLEIMFKLNSNPEIIRYAEDSALKDLNEAHECLKNGPLKDYKKYGYGRFAVELKDEKKTIGFCGIKYLPELDLNEIGYRFLPEYWGKGDATEAAKACVGFAKNDLKLPKIVALIAPRNIKSIKVAEKLGMTDSGNAFDYGKFKVIQYEMFFN